jgi:amino acid transporter
LARKITPVFQREATGLVREIGPLNAFATTVGVTNIGLGIASGLAFVPFVWPGSNVALSYLIFLPFMAIHALMYTFMGWSMPRSGGDYVWSGRILHPAVGSLNGLSIMLLGALANGAFASYIITYGVAAIFISTGLLTGNAGMVTWAQSLFSNNSLVLVLGTLILVASGGLMIIRLRTYLRVQMVFLIVATVGTIAAIALFAFTTPAQFASIFDHYLGSYSTYNGMVQTANSAGFSYVPTLGATFGATAYAWWSYSGYQYGGFFAGELKSVKNTLLWSSIGNLIYGGIFYVAFAFFFVNAVGSDWLNHAAYVAFGTSSYNLPISFSPYFFASLISNNVAVAFLINFSLLAWGIYEFPPLILGYTRIIFGASFDRILPSSLADVSERFHTPVKATVLATFLMWLGLVLGLYYGIVFAEMNTIFGLCIVYAIGCITATVFPFVKKSMYNASPIARFKLAKIPLISILGIISFLFFVYLALAAGFNPSLAPTSFTSYASLIVIFLVLGSLFYISRAYHKKRDGFDIMLTFKELPPE